jgi:ubiquinone/menaquinone biosynthesis C-methylase UbiE
MADRPVPSPELFDEAFAKAADGPRTKELIDAALGPFPAHVEPYSLVPRQGLERVMTELRLRPGDHLVDLCCGRGGIGLWFARETGASLTGVDFSPRAIADASRRAALFVSDDQASFTVADVAQTPLASRSANAVVCIDALHFVRDKEGFLHEVVRLLRPGGRAVFTTWERIGSEPERMPADVGALVEAAGLTILVREEQPEWLDRQRRLFERAVAEDNEQAEPSLRSLAEEGRAILAQTSPGRRLLIVAELKAEPQEPK